MLAMARVKLDMTGVEFIFRTEMEVRITDINYGRHVGNVVLAKTGMVAFDYARNRLADLPAVFLEKTGAQPA
jgi:hypothetical protein